MYLAVSKHKEQPATLIEVAALSDMLGETIEIYRLTPRQTYQHMCTIRASETARNHEHKMPLKLFFHEEHYFGITPNRFGGKNSAYHWYTICYGSRMNDASGD